MSHIRNEITAHATSSVGDSWVLSYLDYNDIRLKEIDSLIWGVTILF